MFTTGNANWIVRVNHCRRLPTNRVIVSGAAQSTFVFENNMVNQDAAIQSTGPVQVVERWNAVSGSGITAASDP